MLTESCYAYKGRKWVRYMASIEEMTVKDIHRDVSFIIHENFLLFFGEIDQILFLLYFKIAGFLFTFGSVCLSVYVLGIDKKSFYVTRQGSGIFERNWSTSKEII